MKKGEIMAVAQLLTAIKDDIEKIGEAQKNDDAEKLSTAKREILNFQKRLREIL